VTLTFVTGTDTGVGKTVVVAAIAAIHHARNRSVAVVKPAQTGVTAEEPGDLEEVKRLAGPIDAVEGIRLPDPLAPDRAALVAGIQLPSLPAQRDLVLAAAQIHDVVLVEGAGGVTVNLGDSFTLLDIAAELEAAGQSVEWLVVTRAGLGTLNHTRLTVSAIRDRGLHPRGLVLGAFPAEPSVVDLYNLADLPRYTDLPLLGVVPERASELPPAQFRAEAPRWLPLQDVRPGSVGPT
jgi:dethiobiotin synthetase